MNYQGHPTEWRTIQIPKAELVWHPIDLQMTLGGLRHWGLGQLALDLEAATGRPAGWPADAPQGGHLRCKKRFHIAYDRGPGFRHPGTSGFRLGKGSIEATLDLVADFLDTQPQPWLYIGTPTRRIVRVSSHSLKRHRFAA